MAWSHPQPRRIVVSTVLIWLLVGLFWPQMSMAGGGIQVVPIRGTIEWGLAGFIRRAVHEAENQNATAILLEINTFGGRVDAATEIRDALLGSPVPVIAFVTERAWSAGALIAMASEHLVMAPGASIGAAEPRPAEEKTISAVRAEFEATAQGRGRDPQVAAAMVDKDVSIKGLVAEGKILTLSANKAADIGFIDFVASSRREVLQRLGYGDQSTYELRPTWAERTAGFLTQPGVSSLLLILGFAGLIFEILTPGFGVPGTVGIISLVLFFGGRMVIGLAGWEVAVLFVVGMILLLVEVFVIPGFGLAGILGLGAVFGSIVLSYATAEAGVASLSIALVATVLVVALGWRYIRRSSAWQRLVLSTRIDREGGYTAPTSRVDLLGKIGKSQTPLRPSGIIEIEGQRVDAVTEGGFIAEDTPVQVISVEGNRIVVRMIGPDDVIA
ncbi:MAG: nodulation protein NfeD [Firmicutes bacterium]|jgi:membrane-bound serine protease (ClpP class)|nr:nodulation protein NfeD [Bacillota bacterium]